MKNYTELSLENLQRTSKNWDGQTKVILLSVDGSGGMFGGGTRLMHITLHGENSITETGTITINGLVTTSYNISRGANGGNSQSLSYYKGLTDFNETYASQPTIKINIEGSCGGAESSICEILSAEKDWISENN